jgi:nicotinamidase-related amidase
MQQPTGLLFGPLSPRAVHVCIDMQRLFGPDGPWNVPWIMKILPQVTEISTRHRERTIFTRFRPPEKPQDLPGRWQDYYEHWNKVTLRHLDERLLELFAPLAVLSPPALSIDRPTYSAFSSEQFRSALITRHVDALVFTGSETDVCVLATALSAIDRGYRVVMVQDALCSSSDASHDALLALFNRRFSKQVETITTEQLLSVWDR